MANDWAFSDGPETQVRTTKRIMAGGPMLAVHHQKGEWQFADAQPDDEAVSVTLGELVERFPWVTEFADLPAGGKASRDHVMAPWHRD